MSTTYINEYTLQEKAFLSREVLTRAADTQIHLIDCSTFRSTQASRRATIQAAVNLMHHRSLHVDTTITGEATKAIPLPKNMFAITMDRRSSLESCNFSTRSFDSCSSTCTRGSRGPISNAMDFKSKDLLQPGQSYVVVARCPHDEDIGPSCLGQLLKPYKRLHRVWPPIMREIQR